MFWRRKTLGGEDLGRGRTSFGKEVLPLPNPPPLKKLPRAPIPTWNRNSGKAFFMGGCDETIKFLVGATIGRPYKGNI